MPSSHAVPQEDEKLTPKNQNKTREGEPVSLKDLAEHLGLSPTTLSLVLNKSPKASAIPDETKERIFTAARELKYRPNYLARSLRVQKTNTIGVIVPELSDGYSAMVLNGVEAALTTAEYFYLTASHLHKEDLLEKLPRLLVERQVEGIIAVDTPIRFEPSLPVVNVSGHDEVEGVTNVILNHQHAAELGIGHLYNLGHRRIAVIKGQEFSSDTNVRLETIKAAAAKRGIPIDTRLTVQLLGDSPSSEVGYTAVKSLLANGEDFTAVFAFNDISAIGAIRALDEMGLRVPADVSVLGFDDIYAAAFHNPALTTIRQPLFEMGSIAARALLERLSNGSDYSIPEEVSVEPTIIVRQSTARVSS
ncbi:MAG TPA: LacI family DNA-binding transcriptional regulator [Pyrinomonadaceae bacterium]|nr:LacI family DNA-binding transcriptional regulator [Pyrinomonadaceae bacterium]